MDYAVIELARHFFAALLIGTLNGRLTGRACIVEVGLAERVEYGFNESWVSVVAERKLGYLHSTVEAQKVVPTAIRPALPQGWRLLGRGELSERHAVAREAQGETVLGGIE